MQLFAQRVCSSGQQLELLVGRARSRTLHSCLCLCYIPSRLHTSTTCMRLLAHHVLNTAVPVILQAAVRAAVAQAAVNANIPSSCAAACIRLVQTGTNIWCVLQQFRTGPERACRILRPASGVCQGLLLSSHAAGCTRIPGMVTTLLLPSRLLSGQVPASRFCSEHYFSLSYVSEQ